MLVTLSGQELTFCLAMLMQLHFFYDVNLEGTRTLNYVEFNQMQLLTSFSPFKNEFKISFKIVEIPMEAE